MDSADGWRDVLHPVIARYATRDILRLFRADGAKMQLSGNPAFTLDFSLASRQRRLTMGRWPEWSVTAVRQRIRELRRMIDEGEDPLTAKEELRVTDMIDHYIREHLPKLSPTNTCDQISMLRKMAEPSWRWLVTDITNFREFLTNRLICA